MRTPLKYSLLAATLAGLPLLHACSDQETPEQKALAEQIVKNSEKSAAMYEEKDKAKTMAIERISAPEGAKAAILSPADGATVSSPVTITFSLEGMDVAPAGTELENSGHHHLLIDLEELPDMNMPLPANDNVMHFGKGQTETELELAPGIHTLQLLLGDYRHVPHEPPVLSEKITITVE